MKPGRKRKLVDEVRGEWQVSIRKACEALEFDRSTYHYKSRRSGSLHATWDNCLVQHAVGPDVSDAVTDLLEGITPAFGE